VCVCARVRVCVKFSDVLASAKPHANHVHLISGRYISTSSLNLYRLDVLSDAQQTVSKQCRQSKYTINTQHTHTYTSFTGYCPCQPVLADYPHVSCSEIKLSGITDSRF